MAFTGFPYAIALRTGSAGAVAASFILFFPFAFLTPRTCRKPPYRAGSATVATVNPVSYVLDGLRSLVMVGWDGGAIAGAIAAISVVG